MIEQNVEVDPFIGQTFGEGGHLRVVREGTPTFSKQNKIKRNYIVLCSVCVEDPELFGNGEFSVSKSNLVSRKAIPCGCSASTKWTKKQWSVKIDRKGKELNFTCVDYEDNWSGWYTRISLKCNKHDTIWKTRISNILRDKCKCPDCEIERQKNLRVITPDEWVVRFFSTNKFLEGTKFTEKEHVVGGKQFWEYTCPRCSSDEYVQNGLCNGVFPSHKDALELGKLACRCSKAYRYTENQRVYYINKVLNEEKSNLKFLGFEKYKGFQSNFWFNCSHHGKRKLGFSSFKLGTRCNACTKTGYDPVKIGYLYVIKAEGVVNSFVGYGITNNTNRRLMDHRQALKEYASLIDEVVIFKGDGYFVREVEHDIKNKFDLFSQDVKGFRTEATYTKNWDSLLFYLDSKLERSN